MTTSKEIRARLAEFKTHGLEIVLGPDDRLHPHLAAPGDRATGAVMRWLAENEAAVRIVLEEDALSDKDRERAKFQTWRVRRQGR